MPSPAIGPEQVGRDVTLRVITRAGPTDLVGTLLDASGAMLTVRRRDGSVAEIPTASVAAARIVPPGPARRVSVEDLQRTAALGWRALEVEPLGAWLLRAGGGFTGRANSALPVGSPGSPLAVAVARVQEWYAERGLPPMVQLPLGATALGATGSGTAGLEAVLDEQGWAASPHTHVMTAEIAHVLRAAGPAAADVRLDPEPDEAWLACYRADAGPLPATARTILTNHSDVVFASVRDGAGCVAIARAAVDGRWAGVFAVEVAPQARRRGLGTAITAAVLRWSSRHGARHTYLQTLAANEPALTLYERLGFAVHHDYVYRTAP